MMQNRCSSSHNMVGPCSCGLFHTQTNSSLSMFFSSMPTSVHKATADDNSNLYSYPYAYPYPYSSAATSVDCTLSLGTPSTRMREDCVADHGKRSHGGGVGGGERRSSITNFCLDILGQSSSKHAASSQSHKGSARGGGSNSSSGSSSCSGDPLLARRCANCDTTSTPLWRNGPRGPKSLCNACGIRFKKEERRATAAAATTTTTTGSSGGMEAQQLYSHQNHYGSWAAAQAPQQKLPCYGNEYRFIDDDARDSDNGISFLSWRLNVTDRPNALAHDFTR